MGFTLKITNVPSGSTHWSAHFYSVAEGAFISPPGMLALDEVWDCSYNPYGATNLRVLALDAVHAITLHDTPNLGPIEDGKDYVYDCSAGKLSEAVPPSKLWLYVGGGIIAVIVITLAMRKKRR